MTAHQARVLAHQARISKRRKLAPIPSHLRNDIGVILAFCKGDTLAGISDLSRRAPADLEHVLRVELRRLRREADGRRK